MRRRVHSEEEKELKPKGKKQNAPTTETPLFLKLSLCFYAFIMALLIFFSLSFIITNGQSLTFGHDVKPYVNYLGLQKYFYDMPTEKEKGKGKGKAGKWKYGDYVKVPKYFTLEELKEFDGSNLEKPILLSIYGHVFDVTSGADYYKKGAGYGFFSGKDCSRAYVTGCFDTHCIPDTRGFTESQIKSLEEWVEFYMNHDTYKFVGKLKMPKIDPDSPLPEDCNKKE